MGTGYTRNDTGNNIADGNIIDAADLDGEFDAIVAAFNASTGHTHDGTTAEGGPITAVGPGQEVVFGASSVLPATDDAYDLGSAAAQFKDLHLDGVAYLDSISFLSGGTFITTTGSNTATQLKFDMPDTLAGTDADIDFFSATAGSVEFSVHKGAGSDDPQHTFFNNSVLLARDGAGTVTIGSDSSGTFALAVFGGSGGASNIIAEFHSTDAGAYLDLLDNSTTNSGYVGVGAEGDDLHFRAGAVDIGFFTSTGLRINGTGGAGSFSMTLRDRNDSFNSEFIMYGDGDVENTNNSYAGISDERLKENIVTAGSQWDDIKSLKFKNYNLIGKKERHFGVIAQDLIEAGMAGLVKENPETGMYSVKYSILLLKAAKALQEALERIEKLEARDVR